MKANQKGRSKGGPPFVQLYRFLLESPAWLSLNPYERSAYLVVAQTYNGTNNGRLGVGVRKVAEAGGMNKNTAAKALSVLEERGFLECATPGGFSRKTPHATEWRLTCFGCDKTRLPGSKAFMRWRPDENCGPTTRTVLSRHVGQLSPLHPPTVPPDRTVRAAS